MLNLYLFKEINFSSKLFSLAFQQETSLILIHYHYKRKPKQNYIYMASTAISVLNQYDERVSAITATRLRSSCLFILYNTAVHAVFYTYKR
jgi:hypothetical protein